MPRAFSFFFDFVSMDSGERSGEAQEISAIKYYYFFIKHKSLKIKLIIFLNIQILTNNSATILAIENGDLLVIVQIFLSEFVFTHA